MCLCSSNVKKNKTKKNAIKWMLNFCITQQPFLVSLGWHKYGIKNTFKLKHNLLTKATKLHHPSHEGDIAKKKVVESSKSLLVLNICGSDQSLFSQRTGVGKTSYVILCCFVSIM